MKRIFCALPVAALMFSAPFVSGCAKNDNTPNYESQVKDKLKDANIKDVDANWNKDEHALHLSGKVNDPSEKQRAQVVANEVVGTSGRVVNEVKVEGVDTRADDRQIEERLDNMFKTDESNKDNLDLKFDSNAGVVTITGKAPSQAEKEKIGERVRSVDGVKDVVNDLDVKAPKTHRK